MSINKNYYVIVGYDLTGMKTEKFDEWKWSDEGEEYICNQRKDEIQLFYDPMHGEYLYLGYILACGNEYEFKTTKFNSVDTSYVAHFVAKTLSELQSIGVISNNDNCKPKYETIVFEECT